MPVNNAQLAAGSNYSILAYASNKPVDQFTTAHPFSQWLIANKKESVFGNGIFNEKVRISNSSNYQNFQFDDQVTYNKKDTVRLAPFQHYEAHDGFTLNETELANNGIIMTDDKNSVPTEAEKIQIVSLVEEGMETLTNGFRSNWDQEVHRDGTQSTKAVPGLDNLISTTPTVGVIGGIDSSTNAFWQNRVNLNINTGVTGTLTQAMEKTYRDCSTVGENPPDKIFCGSKFLDAYRNDAPLTVQRQIMLTSGKVKGGFDVDNGSSGVYFKGIELVWDPVFDILQSLLAPAIAWDKRCYFLNSKSLILRPFKGRWMVNRKPARVYDRYSHYFAITADYGLTLKQRNNMAVLSIL
jgi:hypothetical protein